MSQRPPEIIYLQVPKTFSDKDIEDFKSVLVKATAHTRWENLTIILSNKDFKSLQIDASTYEAINKLKDKGQNVQYGSGRKNTCRTDKYSDETPSKDAEDYNKDNPFLKFRKDGKGNPRNKSLKQED